METEFGRRAQIALPEFIGMLGAPARRVGSDGGALRDPPPFSSLWAEKAASRGFVDLTFQRSPNITACRNSSDGTRLAPAEWRAAAGVRDAAASDVVTIYNHTKQ